MHATALVIPLRDGAALTADSSLWRWMDHVHTATTAVTAEEVIERLYSAGTIFAPFVKDLLLLNRHFLDQERDDPARTVAWLERNIEPIRVCLPRYDFSRYAQLLPHDELRAATDRSVVVKAQFGGILNPDPEETVRVKLDTIEVEVGFRGRPH